MALDRKTAAAARLMAEFAGRTGLADAGDERRRYLWTDAFAVCNFLALARATGDRRQEELARRLVDHVHHVLGRHRPDDARQGWLSGLDDRAGQRHPTRGGLRIGKKLPERRPDELPDERLEWDRDGQYFHYLTQWMVALDQMARATGEAHFNLWARELAATAHAAFVRERAGGGRRMAWKMSLDLARPLVDSMGQHDPLSGLVTCVQLQATASALPDAPPEPSLHAAVADYARLLQPDALATTDPLGLGGLLVDAARVAQLAEPDVFGEGTMLVVLLAAAETGLRHYVSNGDLQQPAARRLAFRELGLAIGLSALPLIEPVRPPAAEAAWRTLCGHADLASELSDFWLQDDAQRAATWTDHLDINAVMLATSLVPDGYLWLPPLTAVP